MVEVMKDSGKKSPFKRSLKLMIIFVLVISVVLAALIVRSVIKYADTHTWVTIQVSAETTSPKETSVSNEREYMKGDTISFADVKLRITDIHTDGTATFCVKKGKLYDDDGKTVEKDTIYLGLKVWYDLDNGEVSLKATDNRYQ